MVPTVPQLTTVIFTKERSPEIAVLAMKEEWIGIWVDGLYSNLLEDIKGKRKMTPIQACKETKELWTMIARISVEKRRAIEKYEISGPWQEYRHNCPCCEYAGRSFCDLCPMLPEWRFYSDDLDSTCEGFDSPYTKWREPSHRTQTLCLDVEFFCLLIAEMAEEAIERLEKN